MTFVDYLDLLRQRVVVILGVVVICTVSAAAIALLHTPAYAATLRLRVRPPAPGSAASGLLNQQQTQTDIYTEAQLFKSTDVANRVAAKLGLHETPEQLLAPLKVQPLQGTAVMVVQYQARQAAMAVRLVNAFATAYLDDRRQAALDALDQTTAATKTRLATTQAELDQFDAQLNALTPQSPSYLTVKAQRDSAAAELVVIHTQLDALADRSALSVGFGEIVEPANSASPVRSLSLSRSLVFGILVGLPLALAIALLLDSLSQTVDGADDAERATGADVLGVIPLDVTWVDPDASRLAVDTNPLSAVSEAYRTLRRNVGNVALETNSATIVFTSATPGEGKSSTVASLAIAYSESGRTAIAVDSDFRRPRLHEFLQARPAPGVAEVLEGSVMLPGALQWPRLRLGFLASGDASDRPDRLLSPTNVELLFTELEETEVNGRKTTSGRARSTRASDNRAKTRPVVLVDAPPVLLAAETSDLVSVADAVVLVVRARITSRDDAAAAAEQVRKAGGTLLGVVVVGGTSRRRLARTYASGVRSAQTPSARAVSL
jgi:Mrp family chromosome partitioning ATPase/capsular polysaccharide biosynthesis protein